MKKSIYKIFCVFILVAFLVFAYDARGQKRPREIRETERKPGEQRSTVERADKWSSGQRKESFKNAVEGKVVERKKTDREPPSRGGRTVEKANKWSRGNLTKKFNDAARPNKNDGGKKDGGGGNPQPGPKPNLPSPARRGF